MPGNTEEGVMGLRLSLALVLIAIVGTVSPTPTDTGPQPRRQSGFEHPEVILNGSEYGQLYPAFEDMDGSGEKNLLVGVGGYFATTERLLIFQNVGTNSRPIYEKPRRLDETVPSARVHDQG
jgi:hypothetical protein